MSTSPDLAQTSPGEVQMTLNQPRPLAPSYDGRGRGQVMSAETYIEFAGRGRCPDLGHDQGALAVIRPAVAC